MSHEDRTNKTFLHSSVAGWGGHLAGAVIGGAGLGLLAGKNRRVGAVSSKILNKAKGLSERFSKTRLGKLTSKHMSGPAGVVGGITGGFVGEEAANYAAIKHNVSAEKKQNRRN